MSFKRDPFQLTPESLKKNLQKVQVKKKPPLESVGGMLLVLVLLVLVFLVLVLLVLMG